MRNIQNRQRMDFRKMPKTITYLLTVMSATKVLVYVPREKCFTSGNYVAYDAETKPQYIRGDGE